MKVRPIGDKVFVIPEPMPDKIGAIYIPQEARAPQGKGTLVATGQDCIEGLETGTTVYYDPMSASEVEVDGIMLHVMEEKNIRAYEKLGVTVDNSGGSEARQMASENPSLS